MICEWCGNEFEQPNVKGPAPKFCSPAHRQRAYEQRTFVRIHRRWAVKRVYVRRPDQRSHAFSARQRQVIITFDTPEDAEAWDRAGQPLDVLYEAEATNDMPNEDELGDALLAAARGSFAHRVAKGLSGEVQSSSTSG